MTRTITLLRTYADRYLAEADHIAARIDDTLAELADNPNDHDEYVLTYRLKTLRDEWQRLRDMAARDLATAAIMESKRRVMA
jgi:hypothetical protein